MIEKFSKITIVVAGIAALIFLFSCNNDSGKNDNKKFSGKTIKSAAIDTIVYQTPNLVVRRISEHTYRHVSYLSTKDFGKVSCNGMIVTMMERR